jgi:integrase/recombinase XerD
MPAATPRILPRKRRRPQRTRKADPSAANPLHAWAASFCEWTVVRGLAASTAYTRERCLQGFIQWLDERGIGQPGEVTRPVLQRYQRHLYLHRKKDGQALSLSTQHSRLASVVAFFKWLTREGHILSNPAADLDIARPRLQLPRLLLSVQDVHKVLNAIPTGEGHYPSGEGYYPIGDAHRGTILRGIRDRAMLEVLYSSGLRKGELMRLVLGEIDTERGTVLVRQGKGRKDRLVPLGERACAWVQRYLLDVRPQLLVADTHTVFLSDWGEPWESDRLFRVVRGYLRMAGIEGGNCHAFRHACATHMLEGGADIRHIQRMLGHSQLNTTEIYTHVAIGQLKAVHALTHPAKLHRVAVSSDAPAAAPLGTPPTTSPAAPDSPAAAPRAQQGVQSAMDELMAQPDATNAAMALLADLAAEHDAENDESDGI